MMDAPWPTLVLAGWGIGLLMGLFGVGGSSVSTPVLALLGVPGLVAIASPLPATIPAAMIGAVSYLRRGEARPRDAAWSLVGGVPGTIGGAMLSRVVGGRALLIASGAVLVVVGIRVARPVGEAERDRGIIRRRNRPLLVAASAVVGVFTGLLANGGGFLLVPLYLLLFGLSVREAAGTSLVVIAVLSLPTLATHWALGHVDWGVAGALACGLLPASAAGSVLAHRLGGRTLRLALASFLCVFGLLFTAREIIGG